MRPCGQARLAPRGSRPPHADQRRDAESSRIDWSLLDRHANGHRIVTQLSAHRVPRDLGHEETG